MSLRDDVSAEFARILTPEPRYLGTVAPTALLGSGIERSVFGILGKPWVVKVPHRDRWRQRGSDVLLPYQTYQEIQRWHRLDREGRRCLAPLRGWAELRWPSHYRKARAPKWGVVFARCARLTEPWSTELWQRLLRIERLVGCSDLHGGNIGLYRGRLVALDYAL